MMHAIDGVKRGRGEQCSLIDLPAAATRSSGIIGEHALGLASEPKVDKDPLFSAAKCQAR